MNNDEQEQIKNLMKDILDFSRKHSNTLDENSAPLWHFAKKQDSNLTLDAVLSHDILLWLSYLGFCDNDVSDDELNFINNILDSNFTRYDIENSLNTEINDGFANDIPPSFYLFYEFDKYVKDNGIESHEEIVESLFNVFGGIGRAFIDMNNLQDVEKTGFEEYMNNLRTELDNMKKFQYNLMVLALNNNLVDDMINSSKNSSENNYLDTLDNFFFNADKPYRESIDISNSDFDIGSLEDSNAFDSENSSLDSSLDNSSNNSKDSVQEKENKDEEAVEEAVEEESIEYILAKLNKLVGLEAVKTDVNSLINLIQIRKIREERGIKQPDMSLHLVFSGNPGTGKTTVARLLGEIYCKLGILSKGHLVETDRSGLVAGYVGQTAIKTQDMIKESMGGILFIDEAYTLSSSKGENDFGQESIDTILKAMEDNRKDFIVIVAGYPDLMDEFLSSNPGLESRFNKHIFFEDYSPEELFGIFVSMAEESSLHLDEKAEEFLKAHFEDIYNCRGDNFSNGRYVRNIFEKVLANQANRLVGIENLSDDDLNTLTLEDFDNCV